MLVIFSLYLPNFKRCYLRHPNGQCRYFPLLYVLCVLTDFAYNRCRQNQIILQKDNHCNGHTKFKNLGIKEQTISGEGGGGREHNCAGEQQR
jgi:hypothetical protein